VSTRTDGGVPEDPADLSIEQAVDRFLKRRQTDSTDRTLRSYESRLERFIEWCDASGIETLGELTAWHLDEYDMSRRGADIAPTTLKGQLSTLRVFLTYAAQIGAVDDDLPDAIDVPNLDKHEETSDKRLEATDALALLEHYRDSRKWFGHPYHAFLELAWHTGARLGGLRALDVRDLDVEGQFVRFVHREEQGTGLKKKVEGERYVGLPEAVVDALEMFVERERPDSRDDHGREPLFATHHGRASFTTLRGYAYLSTEPCVYTECPHGRQRRTCEYTERQHASKCPSTRSPHHIRTGAITWMLNSGLDIDTVAKRVNAAAGTIRRYYDHATEDEEWTERRREIEQSMDLVDEDKESDTL
jgi:site-specific recombinase XerD